MALTLRRVLGTAILLAAAGCPKAVTTPVGNAGQDLTVNTGSVVRLDGTGSCGQGAAATTCTDSQGRPLTFTWSFVSMPTGSAAQLNDPHSVTPSFVADKPGDYVVQLVVANSFLAANPVTVKVTASLCGSNVPTNGALSSAPAQPGVGQVVLLSANAHDADNDSGCGLGQALGYSWRMISQPASSAATLNNANAVTPSFTPDQPGDYTFRLVVTDSTGRASAPSDITVTASSCGFNRPVISALDHNGVLGVGSSVQLVLTGTPPIADADNTAACGTTSAGLGVTFSYDWSVISLPQGSHSSLNSTTSDSPTFIPDVPGVYSFSLVVTSSNGRISDPKTISLTVTSCGGQAPVATINPQTPTSPVIGNTVQLTATASDPDFTGCGIAQPLSYQWGIAAMPIGSHAVLNNSTSTNPSFVADVNGSYFIQLAVTDPQGHRTLAGPCGPPNPAGVCGLPITVNDCGNANPTIGSPTFTPAQTVIAGSSSAVTVSVPVTAPDNVASAKCGAGLNETLDFHWSMTIRPPGSNAFIAVPTVTGVTTTAGVATASATFTADVPNATYQLELVATASNGHSSSPAFYTVATNLCGAQAPTVGASAVSSLGGTPPVFNIHAPVNLIATPVDADNATSGTLACNLGQKLSVVWSVVSRPSGSGAAVATPSPDQTASYTTSFTPDVVGTYQFSVTATDDTGRSSAPTYVSFTTSTCGTNAPAALVSTLGGTPASTASISVAPQSVLNLDAAATTFAAGQAYAVGNVVKASTGLVSGLVFRVTTAGTSGGTEPAWPSTAGATVPSGGVVFTAVPANQVSVVSTDSDRVGTCGMTDPATYLWSIVTRPGASKAIITDPTSPTLTYVPDAAGDYTLQVVATDSTGLASAPAFVDVHVTSCGLIAPVVGSVAIGPPSPVIGQTLTATIPSFADNNCLSTGISSYDWTMVTRPSGSGAVLLNPASASSTFVPDVTGTYQLSVVITDSQGFSSSPFFQNVSVGDCSSSSNISFSNATVSTVWQASHAYAAGAIVRPTTGGSLVFTAGGAGNSGGTEPAWPTSAGSTVGDNGITWTASVPAPPAVSVSFVDPDTSHSIYQTVLNAGAQVSLGANVVDTNASSCGALSVLPYAYQWALVSTPSGSRAQLTTSSGAQPGFVPDVPGDYQVSVIVTDALGRSTPTQFWKISTSSCGRNKPVINSISNTPSGPINSFTPNAMTAIVSDADNDVLQCPARLAQPVTSSWAIASQTAGGSATLSTASGTQSTFEAFAKGGYDVVFSAAAANGQSASQTVHFDVLDCGANAPSISGVATTVNGLAGSRPAVHDTVALNATAVDPDLAVPACGIIGDTTTQTIQSFTWSVVSLPSGSGVAVAPGSAVQSGALGTHSTFTFSPDVAGTFVFAVTATDSTGLTSAPVQVSVATEVCSPSFEGLEYSIGSPFTPTTSSVTIGSAATVMPFTTGKTPGLASLSDACVAGTPSLTLDWQLTSRPAGSAVTLPAGSNVDTTGAVSFTPDVAGQYQITLVVTDQGGFASAAVVQTIQAVNCGSDKPTIVTPLTFTGGSGPGVGQLNIGDVVTFDQAAVLDGGAGHPNPLCTVSQVNGYSYSWALVSVPNGSRAQLSAATVATPSFKPDVPGSYVVGLTVTDSLGNVSSPAFRTVSTSNCGANVPLPYITSGSTVVAAAPGIPGVTATNTLTAVNSNAAIGLTASAYDADADAAACPTSFNVPAIGFTDSWAITSRTTGASSSITNTLGPTTSFTPQNAGTSKVALTVQSSSGFTSAALELPITSTACGASVPQILSTTTTQGTSSVSRPSVGLPVTLSASSADADTDGTSVCGTALDKTSNNQPIFNWTLASGPAGNTATAAGCVVGAANARCSSTSFVFTPNVAGTYVYNVTVTYPVTGLTSAPTTVTIPTGSCGPNLASVSEVAGDPSQSNGGQAGFRVDLQANSTGGALGSSCVSPSTSPLTYAWSLLSKPAGSGTAFTNPTGVPGSGSAPSFTPDVAGSYQVQLVLTDIGGNSTVATQTFTIGGCTSKPSLTATAGVGVINWSATSPDGLVTLSNAQIDRGDRVTLSVPSANITRGTCGTANNATFSYQWSLIGRPAGSTAALSSTTDAAPVFTPDVGNGAYVFTVTITDSLGNSVTSPSQTVGRNLAGGVVGVSDCGTRKPAATTVTVTNNAPQNNAYQPVAVSSSAAVDPEASASASFTACPSRFANSSFTYVWSASPSAGTSFSSQTATTQFTATAGGTYSVSVAAVGNKDGITGASTAVPGSVTVNACGSNAPVASNFTATQQYLDASSAQFSSLAAVPAAWTPNTAYSTIGQQVLNGGNVYAVATAGTSAATGSGPVTLGTNIADNTVRWNLVTAGAAANVKVQVATTVTDADTSCAGVVPAQTFTIAWTLTPPPSSTATLTNANTIQPSFTPDVPGVYTLKETTTDGQANSNTQTFTLIVDGCGTVTPTVSNPLVAQQAVNGTMVSFSGTQDLQISRSVQLSATVADPNSASMCSHPVTTTSYQWAFVSVPAGSASSMLGAATRAASFVPDVLGAYAVKLTAADTFGHSSSSAPLAVGVNCGGGGPVVADIPGAYPTGHGAYQAAQTVPSVSNGTTSTALTVVQSSSATAPVNDGNGVNSGQAFYQNVPVQLSLGNVTDVDGGGLNCAAFGSPTLSYSWALSRLPAGSRAQLNGSTALNPSFTPDVNGSYDVSVTITDSLGHAQSATRTYAVGVCGGQGPQAHFTFAQGGVTNPSSVSPGTPVSLDASVTTDGDANPRTGIDTGNGANGCGLPVSYSYSWSFTQVPIGSAAAFSNAAVVNPTFTPDQSGTYGIALTVVAANASSTATSAVGTTGASVAAIPWFDTNSVATAGQNMVRLRVDRITPTHVVGVGADGRIWESQNRGGSWSNTASFAQTGVTGLALGYRGQSSPIIYAMTNSSGTNILKYDNGWIGTFKAGTDLRSLAVDPTDATGKTVLIGTNDGADPAAPSSFDQAYGFTRDTSGNLQASFVQYNVGLNRGGACAASPLVDYDTFVSAVAATPAGYYLAGTSALSTCTTVTGGRIYRLQASQFGAGSWTAVLDLGAGAANNITTIVADPNSDHVLAGVADGRIYFSSNAGATWSLVSSGGGIAVNDFAFDPFSNAFAAVGASVLRSTSGGASPFTTASSGLPGSTVNAVSFDSGAKGTAYAATSASGFFKTNSAGQ